MELVVQLQKKKKNLLVNCLGAEILGQTATAQESTQKTKQQGSKTQADFYHPPSLLGINLAPAPKQLSLHTWVSTAKGTQQPEPPRPGPGRSLQSLRPLNPTPLCMPFSTSTQVSSPSFASVWQAPV